MCDIAWDNKVTVRNEIRTVNQISKKDTVFFALTPFANPSWWLSAKKVLFIPYYYELLALYAEDRRFIMDVYPWGIINNSYLQYVQGMSRVFIPHK